MSHSWTLRTSNAGTGNVLYDVATDGAGNWIAGGEGGAIVTSTDDGATWAAASGPPGGTNVVRGVCYGNGYWVAVGGTAGGVKKIWTATTPSGTWTERTISGGSWGAPGMTAVTFGTAIGFVAVGVGADSDTGIASTGTDPTTGWTKRNLTGLYADLNVQPDVAFAAGRFVVVGGNEVLTSTNATSWTSYGVAPSGPNTGSPRWSAATAVTYGNGTWMVACSYNDYGVGTDLGVAVNDDVTDWFGWVQTDLGEIPPMVDYGDTFLYRGGANPTAYISSTGASWTEDDAAFFSGDPVYYPDTPGGAAYGNSVWAVVGDDGGGDPYIATGLADGNLQVRDMTDGSLIASTTSDASTSVRATPNAQHLFVFDGTTGFERFDRTPASEDSFTISGFSADLKDWNVDDAYRVYRLGSNSLFAYSAAGAALWNVNLNAIYNWRFPSRALAGGTGQTIIANSGAQTVKVCGYVGGATWTSGGSYGTVLTLDRADGSLLNQRNQVCTGGNAGAQTIAMAYMGPCLWLAGAADGTDFEGETISGVQGWIMKMPGG